MLLKEKVKSYKVQAHVSQKIDSLKAVREKKRRGRFSASHWFGDINLKGGTEVGMCDTQKM